LALRYGDRRGRQGLHGQCRQHDGGQTSATRRAVLVGTGLGHRHLQEVSRPLVDVDSEAARHRRADGGGRLRCGRRAKVGQRTGEAFRTPQVVVRTAFPMPVRCGLLDGACCLEGHRPVVDRVPQRRPREEQGFVDHADGVRPRLGVDDEQTSIDEDVEGCARTCG
jgi:hypothetical protein